MKSEYSELKSFFSNSNVLAKKLLQVNACRKKTLKQKAYDSMLRIVSSRLEAKLAVADAAVTDGSVYLAGVDVQRAIYGDLLEYLSKELLDES